jgi:hypothetical protein
MLAVLMVDLARSRCGSTVATVDYRFRRPVFAHGPVLVAAHHPSDQVDLPEAFGAAQAPAPVESEGPVTTGWVMDMAR